MAGDFGAGLGQVIGGAIAADDLSAGLTSVNRTAGQFGENVAPYNSFGQSFLPAASSTIGEVKGKAGETQSYEDFAKGYTASPGVQYQLQQGKEAQNESAASKGQLLSGTNLRALDTISQGIAGTGMNTAYNEYLQGNNQQFGQLESALGNMFSAIGVGTTATGQQAGVDSSQMNNQAAIAQAQAKNDSSKGSGLGSMFSGLGSMAAMF
jgi:hypothetical protein